MLNKHREEVRYKQYIIHKEAIALKKIYIAIILELTNIPEGVTSINIKTEIVYGSVKSFPEISTEGKTGTDFYLTTSGNSVKITNLKDNENIRQGITVPGGFTATQGTGTFASIDVGDTATIKSANSTDLKIHGVFKAPESTEADDNMTNRYSLRQFIHKTIEKDYLYDGVYTQNP